MPLTVHAGEQGRPPDFADAPPESIVEAVERLGARRIGHGTSLAALADGAGARCASAASAIECCPVSNDEDGIHAARRDHPLPLFLARGPAASSLATDDPLMFGPFTVAETFDAIAGPLGLDAADLLTLTRNGIETAFVSDDTPGLAERPAAATGDHCRPWRTRRLARRAELSEPVDRADRRPDDAEAASLALWSVATGRRQRAMALAFHPGAG